MYKSDNLRQTDNETFTFTIDKDKDFTAYRPSSWIWFYIKKEG